MDTQSYVRDLADNDPYVVREAADALGRLADPSAVDLLVAAYDRGGFVEFQARPQENPARGTFGCYRDKVRGLTEALWRIGDDRGIQWAKVMLFETVRDGKVVLSMPEGALATEAFMLSQLEAKAAFSDEWDDALDVDAMFASYDQERPACWQADPIGLHELRYWDGVQWTHHVCDAGAQYVDGTHLVVQQTAARDLSVMGDSRGVGLATVAGVPYEVGSQQMELIEQVAPVLSTRLRQVGAADWGWPARKLLDVAPDSVIIHAVRCMHGQDNAGWLVATLSQLWWLRQGTFSSAVQPLYYDWVVEYEASDQLLDAAASLVTGSFRFNMMGKSAVLRVGADQFQMNPRDAEYFAALIRDMQEALLAINRADEETASPPADGGDSPVRVLRELAELHSSGVLSDEEFRAKKAEILSRPW